MRRTPSTLALLLGAALVVAACGAEVDEPAPTADPDEVVEPDGSDGDGDTDGETEPAVDLDLDDPVLERAAAHALADAAQRTGREATLVDAQRVTWSDGALGCPQPDQMYTQALVDGVQIVVEADGQTLHYHGSLEGDPTYCEDPESPAQR